MRHLRGFRLLGRHPHAEQRVLAPILLRVPFLLCIVHEAGVVLRVAVRPLAGVASVVLLHLHHLVLIIQWWQSHAIIWSPATELDIIFLELFYLHSQLLDLDVLHPHLLLGLAVLHHVMMLPIIIFPSSLKHFNVLLQSVKFLDLLIHFLD